MSGIANAFKEDDEYIDEIDDSLVENNPNIAYSNEKVFDTFEDIILFLECKATHYPYLDSYDILILPESHKPIIIMNQKEFDALHEKICGRP